MGQEHDDLREYGGRPEGELGETRRPLSVGRKARRRKRVTSRPFIRGPISVEWMLAAVECGRPATRLAILLQWVAGVEKTPVIKATAHRAAKFSLSRTALKNAISKLEAAGLIRADRCHGRPPSITILEGNGDESV